MRTERLRHEFVEFIPANLDEGVLYISIEYATAVHKCCCGCGEKVVTPLTPTDWKLTFDGETVALSPSIGNWSFACQSHYWIRRNEVEWAPRWSREHVEAGRRQDRAAKERRYDETASNDAATASGYEAAPKDAGPLRRVWSYLKRKLR